MYLFAFIFAMVSPLTILAVGLLWRKAPPAFQSQGLAYRTTLSSKSPEAWAFAHRHCSRLWTRIGLILSVLSAVFMVVFRENYRQFILWLLVGQMVFFCVSALLVDLLLKNTFDENGVRIE